MTHKMKDRNVSDELNTWILSVGLIFTNGKKKYDDDQ